MELEEPITIAYGITWKYEDPFQEPKLVQLDKTLHKWFTQMCSEGKFVTGPMIIEKAECFYDEKKITDKCTSSEGSNKQLPVTT
jgi:hypothetical protein